MGAHATGQFLCGGCGAWFDDDEPACPLCGGKVDQGEVTALFVEQQAELAAERNEDHERLLDQLADRMGSRRREQGR